MPRKKEENVLTEALASARYLFRHRGPIQIMGRKIEQVKIGNKIIHLNNQVPALIQDTFDNLRYEQRDGTKPVLAVKRKTEYGWHLVWNLPPGVSFNQVRQDLNFFEDSVNAFIDLDWKHGKLHMNIQTGELPTMAKYEWEPSEHENMTMPIPIGRSRTGMHVLDLTESPHLLIGGATGFGKTSMIASIIHSIMRRAVVVIIDLKGIDFEYLRDYCLVAITNEEAHQILFALNKEFERRRDIIRKHKVRKAINCPEELPYIVLVIDELAELDENNFTLTDRLVRLARATSMSVVAASQRTSTKVIAGDTRSNFVARCCFKVPSPADSRVILGEDCGLAGELPSIKGRCIYRFGIDTLELQAMYLSEEKAEELALNTPKQGGWEVNVRDVKPKTKRLAPR